ncbi:hypothetical protein ILUMI_05136 [Ignelater luminosus]|uniref:BTB domain-containing protein n=1 Tax=Ignelater luminosus TaxID=2038154 RepID=A0A8K0GDW5_IGNLU|nr:hypothetical protein ILUMI_05136 [Ignelater luminosus]
METEQFSLCWNNFHNNLRTGFHSLLQDEDLVDVTLAAEGRFIKAHKTVLSICSPYFKELFKANPCKHPIVILQDVKYSALSCLLQFMYQGEVSVSQDEIPTFMRVAEMLKIKGLTENNSSNSSTDTNGVNDNSFHRGSPYMYGNSESKQALKRAKPPKKIIRPLQPLRAIESPKTVRSPASMVSPHSVPSPQPPPIKKPCIEERSERVPEYVDSAINPKQEPIDHNEDDDEDDDEYKEEESNLDMSAMLDTTLSESSHASASWTPDMKMISDVSSPGTLQCILGKRGNPRLIVDGHVFFKKSTYKGKSFWYCKHSRTPHKCPAVCWTLNGQIVKWPSNHSHVVIPEPFNPEEDMEVPIDRLQEVLLRSTFSHM